MNQPKEIKMKQKILKILSAIGVIAPSVSKAMLSPSDIQIEDSLQGMIYENPDIHPQTMRNIKDIASYKAFLIDEKKGGNLY